MTTLDIEGKNLEKLTSEQEIDRLLHNLSDAGLDMKELYRQSLGMQYKVGTKLLKELPKLAIQQAREENENERRASKAIAKSNAPYEGLGGKAEKVIGALYDLPASGISRWQSNRAAKREPLETLLSSDNGKKAVAETLAKVLAEEQETKAKDSSDFEHAYTEHKKYKILNEKQGEIWTSAAAKSPRMEHSSIPEEPKPEKSISLGGYDISITREPDQPREKVELPPLNRKKIREYFESARTEAKRLEELARGSKGNERSREKIDEEIREPGEPVINEVMPVSEAGSKVEEISEERIKTELKTLPKEEREKIAIGLGNIGHYVEKKKSEFFAENIDGLAKKLDKKSTLGRFLQALKNTYKKDADAAEKKLNAQNAPLLNKISSVAYLSKNILRPIRLIMDATGLSPGGAQRLAMIGSMAFTRTAAATKEARFLNEELLEKTQLDVDKALEEAYKIRDSAIVKNGGREPTAEELKLEYLRNMPKDLQERLKNTSVANKFMQGFLRKQMEDAIGRLNDELAIIDKNDKLSSEKKEAKKDQALRKWGEKALLDYDAALTKTGELDAWVMAGHYSEVAGKTATRALTLQTLYLLGDKLWDWTSHFGSIESPETAGRIGDEVKDLSKNLDKEPIPEPALPTPPGSEGVDFTNEIFIFDKGKGGIQGILDLKAQIRAKFPDLSKAPQALQDFMNETNVTKQAIEFGFFDPKNPAESAHILEGSTLRFDKEGNLVFRDARTGEDTIKYAGKMIDTDKSDIQMKAEAPKTEPSPGAVEVPTQPSELISEEMKKGAMKGVKFGEELPKSAEETSAITKGKSVEELKSEIYEKYKDQVGQGTTTPSKETPNQLVKQYASGRVYAGGRDGYLGGTHTPYYRSYFGRLWGGGFQNFSDLSPAENSILYAHPEFSRNFFHLPGQKLLEAYNTNETNLAKLFPGGSENKIWRNMSLQTVVRIVGNKDIGGDNAWHGLLNHIDRLREVTGLKPKAGGLFSKAETIGEYLARATQRAAAMGRLDQVTAR